MTNRIVSTDGKQAIQSTNPKGPIRRGRDVTCYRLRRLRFDVTCNDSTPFNAPLSTTLPATTNLPPSDCTVAAIRGAGQKTGGGAISPRLRGSAGVKTHSPARFAHDAEAQSSELAGLRIIKAVAAKIAKKQSVCTGGQSEDEPRSIFRLTSVCTPVKFRGLGQGLFATPGAAKRWTHSHFGRERPRIRAAVPPMIWARSPGESKARGYFSR